MLLRPAFWFNNLNWLWCWIIGKKRASTTNLNYTKLMMIFLLSIFKTHRETQKKSVGTPSEWQNAATAERYIVVYCFFICMCVCNTYQMYILLYTYRRIEMIYLNSKNQKWAEQNNTNKFCLNVKSNFSFCGGGKTATRFSEN